MQVIDLGAWTPYLEQELRAPYFAALLQRVGAARAAGTVYPPEERGVLLLNTVLTVGRGAANSHAAWGWQRFTDAVLAAMAALPQPVAFVLWGSQAQKKRPLLQSAAPRLVLCAPHPSPLSSYRGFFGSRPFSQINAFLQENGEQPVDWRLP